MDDATQKKMQGLFEAANARRAILYGTDTSMSQQSAERLGRELGGLEFQVWQAMRETRIEDDKEVAESQLSASLIALGKRAAEQLTERAERLFSAHALRLQDAVDQKVDEITRARQTLEQAQDDLRRTLETARESLAQFLEQIGAKMAALREDGATGGEAGDEDPDRFVACGEADGVDIE